MIEEFTIEERVLYKNGQISICPLSPAALMQNQISGEIEERRMPCNLNCPHANLAELTRKDDNTKVKGIQLKCVSPVPFYPLKENIKLIKNE